MPASLKECEEWNKNPVMFVYSQQMTSKHVQEILFDLMCRYIDRYDRQTDR